MVQRAFSIIIIIIIVIVIVIVGIRVNWIMIGLGGRVGGHLYVVIVVGYVPQVSILLLYFINTSLLII